jgi:hypothetical protein
MIAATYARIAVVALCCLLTATSPSAECAWVLWFKAAREDMKSWELFTAYKTHDACMSNAVWAKALEEKRNPNSQVLFNCLPDTVDPRGPKGK